MSFSHSHPHRPQGRGDGPVLPPVLLDAIRRSPGRVLMLVGAYGSGKTEVSVNLALQLAAAGERVQIADLDLVNPYFRCREARAAMEAAGVRVIVPPGAQQWADLPIVLPEIAGLMQPPEGTLSLFDVGGDDVGARALAAFRPRLQEGRYELWQVINGRRPFSDSPGACAAMRAAVESASRLTVTGLMANSHLGDETTPATVLEGWRLGRETSDALGVPLRAVAAMDALADAEELTGLDVPLLRLQRHLLPPWITPRDAGRDARGDVPAQPQHDRLPAARSVPLGTPRARPLTGGTHG